MKLLLAATALLVTGTCFAGTTTHHWFAKVPVSHQKKVKGFKYKAKAVKSKRGSNAKGQSAILTRILQK
jgi:hypothetical protein